MKRRKFVLASGALAALTAARLRAQTAQVPRRIGWLGSTTAQGGAALLDAFKAKLKDLGYVEGRDIAFDLRWLDGRVEGAAALARELLALKPAVVVTGGSTPVAALKKETSTVPIVFAGTGGPVEQGFVQSLSRPGGNITGVTVRTEVNLKLLDIVRETLPKARRIALLEHAGDPHAKSSSEAFQQAATALHYELGVVQVKQAEDLGRAFAQATQRKAEAVLVPTFALFAVHAQKVAELAIQARLPLFGAFQIHAEKGALVSYNSDALENYRRAAVLVDKILKGANPGELAVEQPDRFRLLINLRTARALGITIPQALLVRADEVIE